MKFGACAGKTFSWVVEVQMRICFVLCERFPMFLPKDNKSKRDLVMIKYVVQPF